MIIRLRYKNNQTDWESSNFILAKAEAGVAIDTGAIRYGNGVDTWANLPSPSSTVASVAGKTGVVTLTKTDVGLENVDNTADADKPISAAQQVVNDTFSSQIASLSETGGVTAETIGLGNVDNTHDIDKPISSATQLALNSKAPINNPVFAGIVQGITKSMVGLAQVDNTADINKPISNATQTALNGKVSTTDSRLTNPRTPVVGSVTDASVSAAAAISMDKIADSPSRVAMTPAERSTIAGISSTLNPIQSGVIKSGTGALNSFTTIPSDSAVVAVGPNALQNLTSANTVIGVGKNTASKATALTDIVALGDNALQNVTGMSNTAIGQNAGLFVDNGTTNVYLGLNAGAGRNNTGDVSVGGYSNTGWVVNGLTGNWERHNTKNSNMLLSNSNLAVGTNSLMRNGIGGGNVAVGLNALSSTANSNANMAIGNGALKQLGVGSGPTGLSLISVNKSGSYSWSGATLTLTITGHNVQAGDYIIFTMTGGSFHPNNPIVANAVRALVDTVIDANSVSITQIAPGVPIASMSDTGNVTLLSYERGLYVNNDNNNLAIGSNSGTGMTTGTNNIFVGANSGPNVTSTLSNAVVLGNNSGNALNGATNILFVGTNTGQALVDGDSVTLIGSNATVTAHAQNVLAIGPSTTSTGNETIAIGSEVSSSADSVAIGHNASTAGTGVVVGNDATIYGSGSVSLGINTGAGNHSVSLGENANTGDNSVAIGYGASAIDGGIAIGNGVSALANTVNIGSAFATHNIIGSVISIGANAEASNINIGNANTTVNIGTSNTTGAITLKAQLVTIDDAGTTSDERDKTDIRGTSLGLDFINSLNPVEYRWAKRDEETEGKRFHQGVIAQQVKEAADAAGIDFGGYIDQSINGGPDKLLVRYDEFVAPLIKAIQELTYKVEWLEGHLNGEEW